MASVQRQLTVVDTTPITPNMTRIVLGGDDLNDFPTNQESGYVKLVFPPAKASGLLGKNKPLSRSYTIRAFDADSCRLVLDFVSHHNAEGPAASWLKQAKCGDSITVSGPGPTKLVDMQADWFFIAGDMSALPAICVNLEKLPSGAKGHAVIEIIDEADKFDIKAPDNIEIHWVINNHPDKANSLLADKVRSLPWLAGRPNVWLACEFEGMRNLRRYFKKEHDVGKKEIYASSYWKIGATDEGHKRAKVLDLEALL